MGHQTLIKGKHAKISYQQKKRMIRPDIMLHTRDVMIPVVKPLSSDKNFNISFSENKPTVLRVHNYRNNPALLFSVTPSHILYKSMENLLQVKKVIRNHKKSKIQSTKYTITGKMDTANIKKANILQNSYASKILPCKRKYSTLHFPNTMFIQSKALINDKNLKQPQLNYIHKTSSKSIKLSRKCNLLQEKVDHTKHKIISKTVIPIECTMSKSQSMSVPIQSLHNPTDTISTISSKSNFKIENKKTFANIANKRKSMSNVASNHLHPSSSECEINVLNYETDIQLGNKFSHLNLPDAKWLNIKNNNPIKIQKIHNEKFGYWKNVEEYRKWCVNKDKRDIKYSWEAVDDWLPPHQRKGYNSHEIKNFGMYRKPYDCKLKYSWQVIGISTQTSYSLLQDLLDNTDANENKSTYKTCIKYSWQIIGISTQASLHDYNDLDYWKGILLTPNKNYNEYRHHIESNGLDHIQIQDYTKYPIGRLKKYLILNNQQTQTLAEKEIQTDYYTKYSWHNLIKQYL